MLHVGEYAGLLRSEVSDSQRVFLGRLQTQTLDVQAIAAHG